MALRKADTVIKMITPDLKCLAYYSSQAETTELCSDCSINVMGIQGRDLYLPIDEVKSHFKQIQVTLPYSIALKQQ